MRDVRRITPHIAPRFAPRIAPRIAPRLAASLAAFFHAAGDRPPATAAGGDLRFELSQGNGQRWVLGERLPTELSVRVFRADRSAAPGVRVRFRVTAGGGTVIPAESVTDVAGFASAAWTRRWWTSCSRAASTTTRRRPRASCHGGGGRASTSPRCRRPAARARSASRSTRGAWTPRGSRRSSRRTGRRTGATGLSPSASGRRPGRSTSTTCRSSGSLAGAARSARSSAHVDARSSPNAVYRLRPEAEVRGCQGAAGIRAAPCLPATFDR